MMDKKWDGITANMTVKDALKILWLVINMHFYGWVANVCGRAAGFIDKKIGR